MLGKNKRLHNNIKDMGEKTKGKKRHYGGLFWFQCKDKDGKINYEVRRMQTKHLRAYLKGATHFYHGRNIDGTRSRYKVNYVYK